MEQPVIRSGVSRPALIVLRGNSASGKTSTAWRLRSLVGESLAIISQDTVCINMLGEPDVENGASIEMICRMARIALRRGFHVVLEGILVSERYGTMLRGLHRDHAGRTCFFYFDLPWPELLARHATRKKSQEFGLAEMQRWFIPHDHLPGVGEVLIGPGSSLDSSAQMILEAAALPPAHLASLPASRPPGC
ncbi:AAA family ATPase [Kitasatospora sp. NPDC057692]|uniref:AAA family ATPase n=1 Tax=Kitasatospora sp. NPDC057692 TaxID=3346215 RepID=UPI0036BE4B4A